MHEILKHSHSLPCGGHAEPCKIVGKVIQSCFYLPILFHYAGTFVKSCDACQRMKNISCRHEMPQTPILEVELFDVWGIDFRGFFPHPQVIISHFLLLTMCLSGKKLLHHQLMTLK